MAAEADLIRNTHRREVWLRGNPRPALALLGIVGLSAVAMAVVVKLAAPPWVFVPVVVVGIVEVVVAGFLAWRASRPRLVWDGDVVEIRLAPFGVHRVPLVMVECVFPGSRSIVEATEGEGRRVGTLILRIAERAGEWQARSTSPSWGSWEDGQVVFDGRWCEPLSPQLARDISTRLLEARRRDAAGQR